jgi:hypothetical protein
MPTSLDNGRRSPKKLLRSVVARLLGRYLRAHRESVLPDLETIARLLGAVVLEPLDNGCPRSASPGMRSPLKERFVQYYPA